MTTLPERGAAGLVIEADLALTAKALGMTGGNCVVAPSLANGTLLFFVGV
jgi:hypothetical protein